MMEEKQDILETPRISQFKHENLFADAFKQSTNNELQRSNSLLQESNQLTILITNTLSPNETPLLTPLSAISTTQNANNNNCDTYISAPKKSFLFRTISQESPKPESKPQVEQKSSNPIKSFFTNESIQNTHEAIKFEKTSSEFNEIGFQKPILTKQSSLEEKMQKDSLDFIQTFETSSEINETNLKNENLEVSNYDKQESFMSVSVSSLSSSFDDTVTSSDQVTEQKVKKKRKSIESNTDVRKQQIRNSNREAARRCRERRRNYIETLESNIRNIEAKQLELMNENSQLHKEIKTLKTILGEHKDCNVSLNSRFVNQIKSNPNKSNFINNSVDNGLVGFLSNQNSKDLNGMPMFIKLEMPINELSVNSNNNLVLASTMNSSSLPLNNSLSNQQVLQKCIDALLPASKSKTIDIRNDIGKQ